jgi:hypothetical protein
MFIVFSKYTGEVVGRHKKETDATRDAKDRNVASTNGDVFAAERIWHARRMGAKL